MILEYGKPLVGTVPRVIETEKEYERILTELEKLDSRGKALATEEWTPELLRYKVHRSNRGADSQS